MHRQRREEQKREDYVPDGFEKRVVDAEERERQEKEEKKAKRKAAKKAGGGGGGGQGDALAITDGAEEADPDMAAMLGFSGFGGKK